jgi:hypothetical protein
MAMVYNMATVITLAMLIPKFHRVKFRHVACRHVAGGHVPSFPFPAIQLSQAVDAASEVMRA